jgi:hypothetical protein
VLDAKTGAIKRIWGAFGNPPDSNPPAGAGGAAGGGRGRGAAAPGAAPDAARGAAGAGGRQAAAGQPPFPQEGAGPETFVNPVHTIKVSNDGLVYVADRTNRRVQIFTPEGKYVTQVFVNRPIVSSQGTAAGIAFSPDKDQTFMYVASYPGNMVVMNRQTLEVLYQFGGPGAKPGELRLPHEIAVDSKGNLYVAEVTNTRAQKFLYRGMSKAVPANALTADRLSAMSQ